MAASTDGDIAIIGLACRFPGDAVSPDAFYEMLLAGRDAWRRTPSQRFNVDVFLHPSHTRQGTTVVEGGYYLKDDLPDAFDAPFFSMTKGEADAMDPQQRILLEVAFESMENAGIPMEKLVGSDTSCFVGGMTKDYENVSISDVNDVLQYSAIGNGLGMLSNRLSWFYDLRGPSMSVDTACSSSMVALHLGCQAIRAPGCQNRTAIIGGTGLILAPDTMITGNALKVYSPDSRCFSFDARANGYGRGEGACVLVLKHIDDAVRDGDTIRAVIRGSGVNQDGKTPGITMPRSEAQASLIRATYKAAGLDLKDTKYFEAHGTGTPAGDPIEMQAIASTFSEVHRDPEDPLFVGTVKPNIGHLEGCAGLAGILKTVFILENGMIPPNLNFVTHNPKLRLKDWNLKVPVEPTPWPRNGLRRASVNSFGYGGTNAHVILDDAYHYLEARGLNTHNTNTRVTTPIIAELSSSSSASSTHDASSDGDQMVRTPSSSNSEAQELPLVQSSAQRKRVFVFSGPDQTSVDRLSKNYVSYLSQEDIPNSDGFLADLAFTLGCRRSLFTWRSAFVASSVAELLPQLSSKVVKPIRAATSQSPKMLWVFTGQGAQWFAMGRELLAYDIFKSSTLEADNYLKSIGAKWSAHEELTASEETSRVNQASIAQPLCTVLQIALVDLMHYWGLHPSAVVGHSSGEIAAAYACGALTAHDCLKISFKRGHFSQQISVVAPELEGAMMSVGLSEEAVRPYLEKLESTETVVVACVNSPSNVTLSGDRSGIDKLEAALKESQVFARKLKVDTAYHSPHMQYASDAYLESIQAISLYESAASTTQPVSMYSSVTGSLVSPTDLADPQYWVNNMLSPVQFVKAVNNVFPPKTKTRLQANHCIVEIGPHGALRGPLKQILAASRKSEGTTYLSMLHRGDDAITTSLETAAKLWSHGVNVNLKSLNHTPSSRAEETDAMLKVLPDLPSYPWNHDNKYWHVSSKTKGRLFAKAPRLDWLGAPVDEFNPLAPLWKNTLRVSELPWLTDHRLSGTILFPGAGMLCCALEAVRQLADADEKIDTFELKDISFLTAFQVPETEHGVDIFTSLKSRKSGLRQRETSWWEFTIYSLRGDETHLEHSYGLIRVNHKQGADEQSSSAETEREYESYRRDYSSAKEECTEIIKPKDMYIDLNARGMQLGDAFQIITDLRLCPGKGVVELTLTDTKAGMPCQYEYDHLIHPMTLDACLHSAAGATSGDHPDVDIKHAAIPISIDQILISAEIPRGPGKKLYGLIKNSKAGFREMDSSLMFSDASWDKPLVAIKKVRSTHLGGMVGDVKADSGTVRKICSKTIYREDIDLIEQKDVDRIFQHTREDPRELDTFMAPAQKAAVLYMKRALDSLTTETESTLAPYLTQLVEWMREKCRLAQEGALRYQGGSPEWLSISAEEEKEFLSWGETTSDNAKLLAAIGNNLIAILNGTVDPFSVMMQDNMLSVAYAEAHGVVTGIRMVTEWFDIKGHKQPDMKILEVGAGTGSITLPILKALMPQPDATPRFGSYVFTDISPAFFEAASDLLRDWEGLVEFKRLDIEKDPIEQGFETESFDVIAAANVLHATSDVVATLRNCLRLLKPGGKLILDEITNPPEYLSLIYGTLPGWWLFQDGRSGPTLSVEGWAAKAVEAGFNPSGFDIAAKDATSNPQNHIVSMMVATKPETKRLRFDDVAIVTYSNPSTEVTNLTRKLMEEFSAVGSKVESMDLDTVSHINEEGISYCHGKFIVSLLEVEAPLIADLGEKAFGTLQQIIFKSKGVLWVTSGSPGLLSQEPHTRAISGLFRVVKAENGQLKLHELHLSRSLTNPGLETLAHNITRVFEKIPDENIDNLETEVIEEDGLLKIPRIVDQYHKNMDLHNAGTQRPPEVASLIQPGRPLALAASVPGILGSLYFIDDEALSEPLLDTEIEIEVLANSISDMDIMVAMGHVSDRELGSDAAGIVRRVGAAVTRLSVGDRVAILKKGAMRTTIRVDGSIPQVLPEHMSLEHGSSVPTVYVTAFQALHGTARLSKGESVLIHKALDGLGQALIQIAQNIGAEIYATVASNAQRETLREQYSIPDANIFNYHDLSFAKGIKRVTNGQGVDVIINRLEGEALKCTWDCIADFGRFIEVGVRDILANSTLDMAPFSKSVTFASVNIEHMSRVSTSRIAYLMEKVFELIRSGDLKMATHVAVYDYTDMVQAFQAMSEDTTTGKIVLKITPESKILADVPKQANLLKLDPNSTYVLAGGLGGLGRGMASYFADHGAKHLAFISRSGATNAENQKVLDKLSARGVQAVAHACDVTDNAGLKAVITEIKNRMPPIKGLIQAAMVLKDSLFENMDYETWKVATRPKIQGTWNLHQLMPTDLDFFIMLSSSTGILGNPGQANYCAGNTFQDQLAHYRHSLGLPAIALDFGAIRGIGWVAENNLSEINKGVDKTILELKHFYSILNSAITGSSDGKNPIPIQFGTGVGTGGESLKSLREGGDEFFWLRETKFAILRRVDAWAKSDTSAIDSTDMKKLLRAVSSLEEAIEIVLNGAVQKLAKSLMLNKEDIDVGKPCHNYGVDSLVAIDFRNWIFRECEANVSVFDILDSVPLSELAGKIARGSQLVGNLGLG